MKDLPDFMLLFDQIGHYLSNPANASLHDLKVAQDAYDVLVRTIYRATVPSEKRECNHDHTINPTILA